MSHINVLMRTKIFQALRFEIQTQRPLATQQELLFEILRRNRDTAFGKKHEFRSIRSITEYQRRVRINTYETLRPYIRRMMKGETNLLIKDAPVFFGVTSGTTNKPKFIPVTECSLRKKSEVMNLWLYYMIADHPAMFAKKSLVIISQAVDGTLPSGLSYGSESGHAYLRIPWIIRGTYVLPYEVFTIKDYDARYYAILRFALQEDISNFATMNPLTILVLCQKIPGFAADIIEDIRRGTLRASLKIEPAVRARLVPRLRPDPARARFLEGVFIKSGTLAPKDVWPHLELIECWKGGSVGMYLSELRKYFLPRTPVRDFGYLATEGRFSIPRSDSGCAGVMAIGSNFYEFLPEDEAGGGSPRYLTVDELKQDRRYHIFLTTTAGLYRYDIGDIIRVAGFHHKTPLIEFVQKSQNVSSVAGEKLYERQVSDAMQKTRVAAGCDVAFFCCTLDREIPPRYTFYIEFMDQLDAGRQHDFLRKLEQGLCSVNVEYKAKRKSHRLRHPTLQVLERGSYERFRKAKLASLPHDSQFKYPNLKIDFTVPAEFAIAEEVRVD